MASKDTPKKLYKKQESSSASISRCRLCNCISDPKHSKNIYRKQHETILRNAEILCGGELRRESGLPHQICAPCERRLNNAVQFRKIIIDTQRALSEENVRSKRCVEISPSVEKPSSAKVHAAGTSRRRRSIDFTPADETSREETSTGIPGGVTMPMGVPVGVETLDESSSAHVLTVVNKELIEVTRRSEPSVLRHRSYVGLSSDSWMSDILTEMESRCPMVHKILCCFFQSNVYPEKKKPGICLIYGIMMFLRCHELSRVQRINSILLSQGHASVNLIAQLNNYGICSRKKYTILDEIGTHFLDRAVELVKSGLTFVFVLDNIDWEEKAHDMRQNVQNRSVHAVATSVVFNRVPDENLPDSGPQKDLRKVDIHSIVAVNKEDLAVMRSRYRVVVARLLFEHFEAFKMFKPSVPQTTDCIYAKEMAARSEVLTMPVLMKDEKKYSDCVDVLDQLEKWTHDIYSAAGLCSVPEESIEDTTPAIGTTSRPDQPASHVPPTSTESDPLHAVKIPCYGDQLSRVRLAGGKDLRAGCHSAKQRLDHLYPFCIVDWHTKRGFLKTVYKKLYKSSGRERGTLRFFREKLNRRNVTIDVKHYEDCEQLFFSVGKCFVVEALMEFFQMVDAKHEPTANGPHSVNVQSEAYQKSYINEVLDKFLDEYVFGNDKIPTTDSVWCYAVNILRSFLLLADIKDAVATGNGEYLSILRKQLLVHFFSTSGFNEYAIEMFINILQCNVLLSEAEAHRCKWAATVNWKGGAFKNIEIDLFQENRNCEMKKLINSMGANKTEQAIGRASKASGGVTNIVEAFENQVKMRQTSSTHSHKSSADDECVISKDLRATRPFKREDNRMFPSFAGVSHDPVHPYDEQKFKEWIDRHTKNILMHYPVLHEEESSDSD